MFDTEFMQRAFIAALMVGIVAPAIGVFIVQRRLALLGDGLGHVALAGVAVGVLTANSPVWTALAVCVVAALIIELLRSSQTTSADVIVAFMLHGGIAAGAVLMSQAPSGTTRNVTAYLFGSILTTTSSDLIAFGVLGTIIIVTLAVFGTRMYSVGNDEEFALAMGMPVRTLNLILAVLTAATVVLSMRVIGLLLISALMVIPVAVAQLVTRSSAAAFGVSLASGLAMCLGGITTAYHTDTPPGGMIVLFGIAMFTVIAGIAFVLRRVLRRATQRSHLSDTADTVALPTTIR